jgi:acetyl esterase/lipase
MAHALYQERYDVYLYDEDAVNAPLTTDEPPPNDAVVGMGPAYFELVDGIAFRGQTNIAIFGHSRGGASTYWLAYQLEKAWQRGQASGLPLDYTLHFTAYLDAIAEPFTNTVAERRRPPRSVFHSNQFQKNHFALNGEVGFNDDEAFARSALRFSNGQFVTHETIMNHAAVQGVVLNHIRNMAR